MLAILLSTSSSILAGVFVKVENKLREAIPTVAAALEVARKNVKEMRQSYYTKMYVQFGYIILGVKSPMG